MLRHHDQEQLGEKEFIFVFSLSSKEAWLGIQTGQETGDRARPLSQLNSRGKMGLEIGFIYLANESD